ncbi:MAG TPA: ABC transporter permease [Bacillota bacterium]|nr:ABC transporter permease [Bacillota bacterium]
MTFNVRDIAFRYSRAILLIIIIIGFGIFNGNMLTTNNIGNVINQQAPFIILYSFGMTLAIITKGIDCSIGSIVALSSCVAAYFIKSGHIAGGIAVGMLIGLACGCINGLLITKIKLAPFIATYGMDWVIRGMAYIIMGGAMIYDFSDDFRVIATGSALHMSSLLIIAVIISAVLIAVLRFTVYGRNIYSIGSNMNATKLSGINTDRIIISVYAISGFLAAVTGLLYVARLNAAEALIGQDFTLKAIAATLIGGTSFQGGKGGVGNTIIGALIMVFLANGMNLMGISNLWQDAVFGFIIILSALIEKITSRQMATH